MQQVSGAKTELETYTYRGCICVEARPGCFKWQGRVWHLEGNQLSVSRPLKCLVSVLEDKKCPHRWHAGYKELGRMRKSMSLDKNVGVLRLELPRDVAQARRQFDAIA